MNKSELVDVLHEKTGVQKNTVALVLNEIHQTIIESLKKGEIVKISGFGTFLSKKRKSKKGRNPKTGVTVDIPERDVPKFKASKEFKDAL